MGKDDKGFCEAADGMDLVLEESLLEPGQGPESYDFFSNPDIVRASRSVGTSPDLFDFFPSGFLEFLQLLDDLLFRRRRGSSGVYILEQRRTLFLKNSFRLLHLTNECVLDLLTCGLIVTSRRLCQILR